MVDRVVNTPVIVTVASIKPVQPGKKMGAVYGIDGQRWGVWGNQLDKFVEGGVYKILSHKEGEFQGQVLKTVQEFEYIGAPKPAPQRAAANYSLGGVSDRNAVHPMPMQFAQGGDAENTRRRDIFVCGAVNAILSNTSYTTPGAFSAAGLADLVDTFKIIWERKLGPNAKPMASAPVNRNADLDDSIPDFGENS